MQSFSRERLPRTTRVWRFAQSMLIGIQRIVIRLSATFGLDWDKTTIGFSRGGLRFRPLFLSEWFMALGLWEPYVLRRIRISRGDVFVDVGAHIGYYARLAATRVGEGGMVVSIEPDPRNIPILRLNTQEFPNVIVIEAACGAISGDGYLIQDQDPLYTSLADEKTGSVRIPVTTLDEVVSGIELNRSERRGYICKIDVEGSAVDVLRGGLSFIETNRPEIILEVVQRDVEYVRRLLPSYHIERLSQQYYYLNPLGTDWPTK